MTTAGDHGIPIDPDGPTGGVVDGDRDSARESLPIDEVFHLLKSERRRRALRYLLETDEEPIRMRALAEAVAAAEYDTTVDALGSTERQRVYITLYQSHLPQLDRAGVIDYNQERGLITTNPCIEAFARYLDVAGDADDDGLQGWLLPAAAGFGLGGLVALALPQALGAVGTLAAAVLLVGALLAGVAWWRVAKDVGRPV